MDENRSDEEALVALRHHFASLKLGATATGTVTYDRSQVDEYASRVQLKLPGHYIDRQGRPLVPPGMLFMGPLKEFGLKEGPRGAIGGIFTGTDRRFIRPVLVGERIRFEGSLTDKYLRNGRFYIEVSWQASDDSGQVVAFGTEAHTLGMVREARE